jgi:nucleobase:cation symporter-1, NCS1 family
MTIKDGVSPPTTGDTPHVVTPEPASSSSASLDVEKRSIDWIPEDERHGSAWRVSPLFFIGNWSFFTVALGFTGPSLGLSLWWSIAAATLGTIFGTFFMAFHATQGPKLGLPQIIQSRAQFGFRGVIIAVLMSLACYLGFGVVNTILTTQGLTGVFGWSPTVVGVVINVIAGVLAIWGHDQLHRACRIVFFGTLPFFIIFTLAIVFGHAGGSPAPSSDHFVLSAFLTQFSVATAYNIAFAPTVSDFTRYLPVTTRPRTLIASVYVGAGVSLVWLAAIGAWLSAHYGATDALVALRDSGDNVFHGFGSLLALLSAATLVLGLGTGAYSVALQFLTGVDLFKRVRPTRTLRIAVVIGGIVVWSAIALPFGDDVINIASKALTLMLYLLVPWTAVNLVDFFFVRRGHYVITDLFTPNGIYGSWAWRGIVAYLVGFASMIPFAVLPFYTGPLASALGDLDISYIPGLVISGALFWLLSRGLDLAYEAEAEVRSNAELAVAETKSEIGDHEPPLERGLLA